MAEPPSDFLTSAYDYELPPAKIAQEPLPERTAARLLVLRRSEGSDFSARDLLISDFPDLLKEGDLLVLNDTRVRKARLRGVRAETGGAVEVLILEVSDLRARILLGTRGRPKLGETLHLAEGALSLVLEASSGDGIYEVSTTLEADAMENLLEKRGITPLPPYIEREKVGDSRDESDTERYQTVFARIAGSAAAPTAGLHFTNALLEEIQSRGITTTTVTLHVGLGTFRPVTAVDLRDHPMHEEAFEVSEAVAEAVVSCRRRGGRVVAVGTTSVRVLESAGNGRMIEPGSGRTRIFLHPGKSIQVVDALLTNFHAPRSTLLMLVSALAGRERTLAAYAHALRSGYRFLSYGDAMFLH